MNFIICQKSENVWSSVNFFLGPQTLFVVSCLPQSEVWW